MSPAVSLVPQTVDLNLYAGDGASLRLTLANPDGQPFDATGSILAQIRRSRADSAVAETFSADTSQADQGIVTLSLTGSQTANLAQTTRLFVGSWDVEWTAANGEPLTLVQGKLTCTLDVTRI